MENSKKKNNLMRIIYFFILIISFPGIVNSQRARDFGLEIGIFKPGLNNAITDVPGVSVGHFTKIEGDTIMTGATAILPHQESIFQKKVPAAVYIGNGFGKLSGISQVKELGNIETPVVLTNTLSVPTAMNALISYTLEAEENHNVRSVNALVGETNDGRLNDIRGRHLSESEILMAIQNASTENADEGNIGAGTGTICFGFKGGIGTSSRKLPGSMGAYTVGVLVQSNFGGVLEINGIPVAKELGITPYQKQIIEDADVSCMIIVITDAPVNERNLERMAKRAMLGLAKTGGIASNGSGDYVIALSNYEKNLVPYRSENKIEKSEFLRNGEMSPLFLATIEATEEAIINSLLAAKDVKSNGYEIKALPKNKLRELIMKYRE